MAVKPQILSLWAAALAAVAGYGIISYILAHPVDNKENNRSSRSSVISGKTMPEAYFFDAKGKIRQVGDFKGRVVLVNLWATWCVPCVGELPSLDRLQQKLPEAKFSVVAISLDRQTVKARNVPKMIEKFLAQKKISKLQPYWDKDRVIPERWNYDGLPTSFLIDANGEVEEILTGLMEWDKGAMFDKIAALATGK